MTKSATASIRSINARAASAAAYEFEYVNADGSLSGMFFSVLGAQSEKVQSQTNALLNERRQADAFVAAKAAKARQTDTPTVTPVENDIAFGERLTAIRLVGWRGAGQTEGLTADQKKRFVGIEEPYSEELALELVQSNPDLAAQALDNSNDLSNFMKGSPKA